MKHLRDQLAIAAILDFLLFFAGGTSGDSKVFVPYSLKNMLIIFAITFMVLETGYSIREEWRKKHD